MKIKVRPEDFVVEEQASLGLSPQPGAFAVYKLGKRSWDTFDLVDYLARRLGVERRDISVGGIKDRFGDTTQLVSVRASPRLPPELEDQGFSLRLSGWADHPVSAQDVAGNRFRIVVRDIDPHAGQRCRAAIEAVREAGLPNYYDEQRFGSARHGKGFMGKELFLGRRERALRLYFTASRFDDRRTRALKTAALENWGRWTGCLPLAFGDYRPVLEYLAAHRGAFRQALGLLDRRFLVFVLNAYQSYLFNEILSGWLRRLAAEQGFALLSRSYRHGRFLYPESLPPGTLARLAGSLLPVPGYDSQVSDPVVREIAGQVLEREGIGWADLRVRQMSRVSVHGVERRALVVPQDLRIGELEADELYPGRLRFDLEFFLPRGSYATLLLKRMQAVAWDGEPG